MKISVGGLSRDRESAAPTVLGIRGNWNPALTHWANFFRASGAAERRPPQTAAATKSCLEFEGFEGEVLGGDKEFAGEGGFGGAAAEGFFGGNSSGVRIVIFLGEMRENNIASSGVKSHCAVSVSEIFAHGVVRKMTVLAQNSLLNDPWVRPRFEHVRFMIRLQDEAIGFAEMHSHVIRQIAEVRADGHLSSIRAEGEGHGVGSVVRNREGMHVDVPDRKGLARLDGFHPTQAFAESFGQAATKSFHRGFGDV